jgi:hypothetical protein
MAGLGRPFPERLLLSHAEILAGVAFLESHAPDAWQPWLTACRKALEEQRKADKEEAWRTRPLGGLGLCVRAEVALRDLGAKTVGDVEKLFAGRSDEWIRSTHGYRKFTKIVLRDVRGRLKANGLNH